MLALREERKRLLDYPGFLRWAEEDDALLVSDAPRRLDAGALDERIARLRTLGDRVRLERGLMYLDLSREGYRALLHGLPTAPPPFPEEDAPLGVYALARLLLAHPAPWERQPLELLREIIKRYEHPAELMARAPLWQARCATLLRQGGILPSDAGRLLAAWLNEQEEKRCLSGTTDTRYSR